MTPSSTPGGATGRPDATCYVERSKVREILMASSIDNESAGTVLQEVDALPIFTAADFSPDSKLGAYRKALEFYADENRYSGGNRRLIGDDPYTPKGNPYMQDVSRDCGDIARKALAAGG